ncbi:conserved hypothetical protein [Theileria orientalis strain Shintoku]|uniref:Transmembrane protein n=1 Tax=Theileria orientalis strain Shintoku TaxID=869250 RepID=J4C961_THEOR|nr:conserved hypothetical protein [Theileria orientalis strain Shintoku]PVC52517.1 hypothetical protein MACL_00000720 [Theileria orientalis]BAM41978.1 conserved hypothetical protein [Theileria orientalis strain Shintoku]|eukprot:XP_009692279.1 conserved hypothetical protein [Theileria orientalis strain Shintoku]
MVLSKGSIWNRIRTFTVPIGGSKRKVYILAFINFFAFGIGTAFSGIYDDCMEDVIIGLLQMLPIVGWAWSVIWGITMIFKRMKIEREERKQMTPQIDGP